MQYHGWQITLTIVVGSVLFTHAGEKPLKYFILLFSTSRLRDFLNEISSHQFSKTLTQLIALIRVFRFSAPSFNAVTSFIRNIFKPGRHLGTEIWETLP